MVTASPPALTAPALVFGRAEAAKALGISVSYIDKLRLAGKARPSIPYGTTGRFVYSRDDLRQVSHLIGRDIDALRDVT